MDKYEFNIKVEQIKKLVNKGDYETAMKIADTIDWRRVRSANLLALVADIYENNEEYQEAKEILLLAFERAPIGKRLLYKLADLSLRENNIREAEDYYREFCDLAPEDPRQHLLRYQILKAKKAPNEQLIHSLERYTNTELDERWLYELAELYCKSGKEGECIRTCDKIMLMFGLGKFVDKAMQLKVQYAPLSSYQMDLIENRDKYEEKLRAVEQAFGDETREIMRDEDENENVIGGGDGQRPEISYSKLQPDPGMPFQPEMGYMPRTKPVVIIDETAITSEFTDEMEARLHQAETEEQLAREMSKISIEEYNRPEAPVEQTKIIDGIRETLSADVSDGGLFGKEVPGQLMSKKRAADEIEEEDDVDVEMPAEKPAGRKNDIHLMIEARTPDKGLELAVEVLKRLHKEKDIKCPVIKITGSRLSCKGVMKSADKLIDKDLIIEEAGDLTIAALTELRDLIEDLEIRVIMIDNPRQIESMVRANPELASLFMLITMTEDRELEIRRSESLERPEGEDVQAVREVVERVAAEYAARETIIEKASEKASAKASVKAAEEAFEEAAESAEAMALMTGEDRMAPEEEIWEETADIEEEPSTVLEETMAAAAAEPAEGLPDRSLSRAEDAMEEPSISQTMRQPAYNSSSSGTEGEMEVHDFVEYTCQYASDIDCSITGKSMLALYERIEVMEENGVPLTKVNAENLIEEAADKAEKFSLGKLFTGLFHPRYDKEGLLILREEHFMN